MEEGKTFNGKMEGYNRRFNILKGMVDIGYFSNGLYWGKIVSYKMDVV